MLAHRLPFWQDEDDMQMSSMAAVRSAVAEPIPLDYGPWLTTSPAGRDFVSRLLQVPLLTACLRPQLEHAY